MMKMVFVYALALLLFACDTPATKDKDPSLEKPVVKNVGNISFVFAPNGFAYDNRNRLMNECLEAIKSNAALIELPQYRKQTNS